MVLLEVLLFAGILTFLITPLCIRFAKRFGFIDNPKRLHPAILHKKPIPRGGGVALLSGVALGILLLSILGVRIDKHLVGIGIASLLIVLVGLADDKYDINPYLRLLTNFLAVLIVIGFGVGISNFTNPLGGVIPLDIWRISFMIPIGLPLAGQHSIVVLSDVFAFLWIIWIMNAINWSSGVDGQLSGIAAISFVFLGLVSLRSISTDPNQMITAGLSFAAAGAYLGFLPWSFYPQKIMPGYSGAALAGFLIAVLAILSGAKLATVFLVLAVPMIDGLWAIARRIYHHQSPVWGDRKHLHHLLLNRGWSIPKIALFYYFVTATLGFLSLSLGSRGKLFAIAMIAALLLGTIITISSATKPAPK